MLKFDDYLLTKKENKETVMASIAGLLVGLRIEEIGEDCVRARVLGNSGNIFLNNKQIIVQKSCLVVSE